MRSLRLKVHRLLHWEYWQAGWIYFPILPFWIFYAMRARSFFFFNSSNPSIKNGGMAMESKKEIYELLPSEVYPKTVSVPSETSAQAVMELATKHQIKTPFIIKPDIGLKGLRVQLIHSGNELQYYLKTAEKDLLIQQYVEYPHEVGIFYYRIPGQSVGRITGIVHKEFLSVTGDGKSTLLELIRDKPRCLNQFSSLNKMYRDKFEQVLQKDEKMILVPYGSHTRGALFTDITNKRTPELEATIDAICKNIKGFYFGRMDIMYAAWNELCEGKNFAIIELNGAGSEPTHIYDPKHSLFFAWREIIRHWDIMFRISMINKKQGHPFLSYREGKEMIRGNNQLEKRLKAL